MKVINSLELRGQTDKKTSVALGSFDALHKGHLAVIGRTVSHAKNNDMASVVQLFEAPNILSKSDTSSINSLQKRLKILEELDVDFAVVERFDEEFRKISYQDFAEEYLKNYYNAAAVFAGENYRFGHLAKGTAKELVVECKKHGIKAEIVSCIKDTDVISSTNIRQLIELGNVEKAAEHMTRPYSVSGEVVHGKELGRKISFPTANIEVPCGIVLPKDGVYVTRVILDEGIFFGITNVGAKPTVAENERNIETHISDFKGDIYGKTIEVEFLKRLRDIKKFDTLNDLKHQLEEDKKNIQKI